MINFNLKAFRHVHDEDFKSNWETEQDEARVVKRWPGLAETAWGGKESLNKALNKGQAWELEASRI